MRCREVVTELLASIRPDETELTRRVTALYLFLFQALTESQLRNDRHKLAGALRVLEIERDTWREVCKTLPDAPVPADAHALLSREVTSDAPAIGPNMGGETTFSLDTRSASGSSSSRCCRAGE